MNQMELIKRELENHIGKKVIVKANKGRKKIVTRKGILTSTVRVTVLDEDVSYKDAKMIS